MVTIKKGNTLFCLDDAQQDAPRVLCGYRYLATRGRFIAFRFRSIDKEFCDHYLVSTPATLVESLLKNQGLLEQLVKKYNAAHAYEYLVRPDGMYFNLMEKGSPADLIPGRSLLIRHQCGIDTVTLSGIFRHSAESHPNCAYVEITDHLPEDCQNVSLYEYYALGKVVPTETIHLFFKPI